MRISIIVGSPKAGSFCHALAAALETRLSANGHVVIAHDLQTEGFDPVMTATEEASRVSTDQLVERHCRELSEAEGLVIVHPVWWGGPPAILKGWVDRVVRPGVAYEIGPVEPGGTPLHTRLLRVGALLLVTTSDTPQTVEIERFRDPVGALWENYVTALCQIPVYERVALGVMLTSTPQDRQAWLAQVEERAATLFPA